MPAAAFVISMVVPSARRNGPVVASRRPGAVEVVRYRNTRDPAREGPTGCGPRVSIASLTPGTDLESSLFTQILFPETIKTLGTGSVPTCSDRRDAQKT